MQEERDLDKPSIKHPTLVHYHLYLLEGFSYFFVLTIFIFIFIFLKSEMKKYVLIVVKIQEKDERCFPQNIESGQCKYIPLYRKLYTKIIPNYLKLLSHKPQSS